MSSVPLHACLPELRERYPRSASLLRVCKSKTSGTIHVFCSYEYGICTVNVFYVYVKAKYLNDTRFLSYECGICTVYVFYS